MKHPSFEPSGCCSRRETTGIDSYKDKATLAAMPKHDCMETQVVTFAENCSVKLGTTVWHVDRATQARSLSNKEHSLGLSLLNECVCET